MFDSYVPIVEINRTNIDRLWSFLQTSVKRADFIAVDLELSGLGDYSHLKNKSFQERYERIVQSVKTRSILSVGLALFYLNKGDLKNGEKSVNVSCKVFNLLTISGFPFTVEPNAFRFLNKHNFDFNKWIETGISYELKNLEDPLCQLWETVLTSGASIIFHNGFLDLAFIYHHLFCEIPESVNLFQSAICDWFENAELLTEEDKDKVDGRGLYYDSKYIAATSNLNATYLEYVFRKYQRDNVLDMRNKQIHLNVKFITKIGMNELIESDIDNVNCSLSSYFMKNVFSFTKETRESVCENYSVYGCCKDNGCKKTHEVDLVLDLEFYNQQTKKKRKYNEQQNDTSIISDNDSENLPYEPTEFSTTGCHRAGMDAFMTGFSVLYNQRQYIFDHGKLDKSIANKTIVPGLDKPLPLIKSNYATLSERHEELWDFLSRKKAESIRLKSNIN